jgi:drug/metabolite transporter (DMT)-like permease
MKLKKGLFDILLLSILWGPSFLFTKIAVDDMAPITVAVLRTVIGGLLLYLVLKYKKVGIWEYRKFWFPCFVIGIFANAIPWVCFSYAIQTISTSLSALINGIAPVLTIILANIFLKDEPFTWERGIGVALGLLGFCVLFLPAAYSSLEETSVGLDMQGILLSFIAACSFAIGWVYVRKNLPPIPDLVAPVMQLFSTLIYLMPLAFIFESPLLTIPLASLSSWVGVLGLSLFGTALGFVMVYRIIARQGATAISTVTYLLPVFSAILGVIFLDETLNIEFYIAAVLILSSVLIVNGVISLPFLNSVKAES